MKNDENGYKEEFFFPPACSQRCFTYLLNSIRLCECECRLEVVRWWMKRKIEHSLDEHQNYSDNNSIKSINIDVEFVAFAYLPDEWYIPFNKCLTANECQKYLLNISIRFFFLKAFMSPSAIHCVCGILKLTCVSFAIIFVVARMRACALSRRWRGYPNVNEAKWKF